MHSCFFQTILFLMEYTRTDTAPAPLGPYEQAVRHNHLVYVAMQLPVPADNSEPLSLDIEEQTALVLDNIKAVLEASGSAMNKTLRLTVYLTDISLGKRVNAIYTSYFPDHKPARSVIQVAALPLGYSIAMDAIAATED